MPENPTPPSPEDIEDYRQIVTQADAAQREAAKAATLAKLQPFLSAGWGGETVNARWADLFGVIQSKASDLLEIDPALANLAFQLTSPLATLNDRFRSLALQNAPAVEAPGTPEA